MASAESMADGFAPAAHVNDLAAALRSEGHTVSVVGEDSGAYHDAGILGRLWRYLKINWRMLKALGQYEVFIARAHFAQLPWVLCAWIRGRPVFHEMNGKMFDAATTYGWLRVLQGIIDRSYLLQFRLASGITCTTQEIADHLAERKITTPLAVVGNGVDPTQFFPGSQQKIVPAAVFPSALAPWHGVRTLLEALDEAAWPPDLRVLIVGDGAQADLVRQKALKDPRVCFLGRADRSELATILREASIGLCLVEPLDARGMREVYPLKLFEMMASGLPIIATDLPGQSDIVRAHGVDMVIPCNNPIALAEAVAQFHYSDELRHMGRRGIVAAKGFYTWRLRAQELIDFIISTLQSKQN